MGERKAREPKTKGGVQQEIGLFPWCLVLGAGAGAGAGPETQEDGGRFHSFTQGLQCGSWCRCCCVVDRSSPRVAGAGSAA